MTTKLIKSEYRIESGECLVRLVVDYEMNDFQILPNKGERFDFTHSTERTSLIIDLMREAAEMGKKLLNDSKHTLIESNDYRFSLTDLEKKAVEMFYKENNDYNRMYFYGAIQKIYYNLPKLFEL